MTERLMAGRELDALVAEQVMGIRCLHQAGSIRDLAAAQHECQRCGAMIDDRDFYAQRNLTYSTDLAAAWEVVEKLPYFAMWKRGASQWCVQYKSCHDIGMHVIFNDCCEYIEADTAPLAICLAALKAISSAP